MTESKIDEREAAASVTNMSRTFAQSISPAVTGWVMASVSMAAAAVTVKHGAGKVVLIGFRPQHRDQTHGTFKLVFNALLNGPSTPARTTTTQQ